MKLSRALIAALAITSLGGCAGMVSKATDRFSSNLGTAVLNSEDPGTVRDGLPSYLILLDSLVLDANADPNTLLAASKLNSAYAGNFTGDDKVRARRLSKKAFDYAKRATCVQDAALCAAVDSDPEAFAKVVAEDKNVELMYILAGAWAGYLQANSEDWARSSTCPRSRRCSSAWSRSIRPMTAARPGRTSG